MKQNENIQRLEIQGVTSTEYGPDNSARQGNLILILEYRLFSYGKNNQVYRIN